jgi:hypothetical protein
MSTMSHRHEHPWREGLVTRELWVSLAITAMWAVVAVSAIWGPDVVVHNGDAGGNGSTTTIPSAVVVTVFAFFGSWIVARYGFARSRGTADDK